MQPLLKTLVFTLMQILNFCEKTVFTEEVFFF